MKKPTSAVLILLATLISAWGCTYERVVRDDMDPWRKLASGERAPDLPTMPTFSSASGWGIELATFSGRRRFSQANQLVTFLKEKTVIDDAWINDMGTHVAVLRGRFESPDAQVAQELLHQTRELTIDSSKRFEKAQLVPFGKATQSAVMASDLAQFVGMEGYTLQVAVFDSAGGPRYREAAEAYCRQLREKNEQAYYYHGPNRSMVTIGLFNESDMVQVGPLKQYGPRIREVQQRFPHNLVNGSTVVESAGGQIIGDQPSTLVHLPRM